MMNRETQAETLLDSVHQLLDAGKPDRALALLKTTGHDSTAIRNACGVCQLRLGQYEMAMWTFRELVFPNDAIVMPRQVPAVFVANYALAHLLMENPVTGISVLHQCADRRHPAITQVLAAVRRWKRSFPWWRRALTLVGVYPAGAPPLDSEPGTLWPPRAPAAAQQWGETAA